jgi:hypothetical protein
MSWGVLLRFLRGGRCWRGESIAPMSQARLAQRTGLSQDRISRLERGAEIGLSEALALRDVLIPWMGVEDLHRVACQMAAAPPSEHDPYVWRDWHTAWEVSMGASRPSPGSPAGAAAPVVAPEPAPPPPSTQLALPGFTPDAKPRTPPPAPASEVEPDELPPPSPVDRALALTRQIRAMIEGSEEWRRAQDERDELVEAMSEAEYDRYSRLLQGR